MIKKAIITIIVVINILFIAYLITPTPILKPLPDSVRSTLPGDTTQLQNVTGYYTNLSRTEVIKFYRSFYSSPLLIRINHPPEKAKEIFRDTMQSYYLEEFIIPFKESLFINGYDWEKDVFTKPEKRIANKLIYNNIVYQSKINTKVYRTNILTRIIIFLTCEINIYLIYLCYKNLFKKNDK